MTTLEKIREEIYEQAEQMHFNGEFYIKVDDALKIVDKYAEQVTLMTIEANVNGYTQGLKDASNAEQDLYPTAYSHYKSSFGYEPTEECDNDCEHCAYLECPKEPTEDACKKCLYAEETDGSHCYECVKGESKFEP